MSALADRLRERIQREGPITFYNWMKSALYDPEFGYYFRSDRERWGALGDYRTSPERSLLFGATFAQYFAKLYQDLGSPRRWTIVEAGAGDGRFAEALLLTLRRQSPQILHATRYVIDELSESSRSKAMQRLSDFSGQLVVKRVEELELLNHAIVFANELLDAFPVHRVVMRDSELREFYVGVNEEGGFYWIVRELSEHAKNSIEKSNLILQPDQIAELNPGIERWLNSISRKLQNGYLIIVDYGSDAAALYDPEERPKGTLRAFHRHRFAEDLLARPGNQDLTSSIDWTAVRDLVEQSGLEVKVFQRQDKFLLDAGLLEELESRVMGIRDEAKRASLRSQAREMILPGGMSESFQVLVAKKLTATQ